MSIGEAEASIAAITEGQFRLIRPNHDSANDSNVRNVFLESPLGDDGNPTFQLAIDYESGLLLIIRPASQDYGFAEDAETQYTEMAAGYPNPEFARLETIHGVPALVIDRNDRGTAYVDLVLEGLRIQLRGAYAPIESAVLVEVAESMS